MEKMLFFSILLFFGGIALFIVSAVRGEGGMALFFIFPIFYSTGPLGALGMLLIFASIFLFFIAPFTYNEEKISKINENEMPRKENQIRSEKHYGGVILIGPIPIVFGSDKNQALNAVIFAIIILMLLAIFLFIMGI